MADENIIPVLWKIPGLSSIPAIWLVLLAALPLYVVLTHKRYMPLPIFGHLHSVAGRSQQDVLWWMLRASSHFEGRPWRLEVPTVGKGWFINDPSSLKYALSTKHASFSKGSFFTERTRDLFGAGHGILLATGDSWRAQRNAGMVLVSPPNLKRFTEETLPAHLPVLLGPLEAAANSGQVIDFDEVTGDYSLAVFGEIAFDADWQDISAHFTRPFASASARTASRFQTPLYFILERVLPYGRRFRDDLAAVHRYARKLVTCTLKAVEEEELGDKVPLEGRGMLVRALLSSSASMSEQQLADSCLNFLTAGRDTTAQALTWTLYRLLLNPSYFTALRAEINALPSISPLDLASHLPLTEAAIAETLRLHPPIPIEILENVSLEPVALPNGKIVGPGEQIMWSPWVMARLNPPKSNYRGIWGDNPEQFKPERWFNLDHKPTAYESPVFHAGPRACLGRPLANLELVYALKEVLVRFEFQMAWDGGMRGVGSGLTAPMVGGLPVRVKRRSNPEQERTAKA